MSKIIKIYCEGKRGSHDYDILEKIFDNVTLVPIGSKNCATNVIEAYEKAATDKADYYFFFRDRDFDKELTNYPPNQLFTEPIKNQTKEIGLRCFGQRTTIENYLLEVEILYDFINTKCSEQFKKKRKITSAEDLKQKLITAAQNIKYYQASRYALSKIGKTVYSQNTWTKESGKLPDDLSENACKLASQTLIDSAKNSTNTWDYAHFEQEYAHFLSLFDDTFFDNMDFLIWFQGKDLQNSMIKELGAIDILAYYKFAKTKFDYTKFPDLMEFHRLVAEKL